MHVDLSEEDSKRLMEFFQATNNEVPTVRIYSPDQNTNARKFVPEFSELTADNIRNFIQEYLDGNLKVGKGERGRVFFMEFVGI